MELDQIHFSATIRACSKAGAWVPALALLDLMADWQLDKACPGPKKKKSAMSAGCCPNIFFAVVASR